MAREGGGIENLNKFNEMPRERMLEIQKMGTEASRKKREERKQMKEQLESLLTMPITRGEIKGKLANFGIKEDEMTNQMAITIALFQEALKGNTKAYEIIRDTIGEKPVEKTDNKNENVNMTYEEYLKKVSDTDEY